MITIQEAGLETCDIFPPDSSGDVASSADPDQHGAHRLRVHHTRRGRGEIHLCQEVTRCVLSSDNEILKGFFLGQRSKFQEKLQIQLTGAATNP